MKEEIICESTGRRHDWYMNFPWECADCGYRREVLGITQGFVGFPY